MAFRVFLDACVLVPYDLCDTMLTLAESDIFQPLWSRDVLDETERALVRVMGRTPEQARRRVHAMEEAFPEAMVDGYRDLVKVMKCHRKDRHVLAAALRGAASVLVTANLKDFPDAALEHYDIEVVHPDVFLIGQFDLEPDQAFMSLQTLVSRRNRPPNTLRGLLAALRLTAPNFAQLVASLDGLNPSTVGPALMVQSTPEEALLATFPDGQPDDTTPQGCAFLWWAALLNLPETRPAFDYLCWNSAAFEPIDKVVAMLDGLSLAGGLHPAVDAPEGQIVFMKFIRLDGPTSLVFEGGLIDVPAFLTLARLESARWRVWGVGPQMPPLSKIYIHP